MKKMYLCLPGRIDSFIKVMMALVMMGFGGKGFGQVISWDNSLGATAWYGTPNWNPNKNSGNWLITNTAQFNDLGTANTAGINMNMHILSIAAVEMTDLRTRNLTIGNSSTSVDAPLTLYGITVNTVSNTILRNGSSFTLSLQNNETGTGKFMGIVLANSVNNIINTD